MHNTEESDEGMKSAVKAVEEKTHTITKAARLHGIPYATLCDRLKKRYPSKKIKFLLDVLKLRVSIE